MYPRYVTITTNEYHSGGSKSLVVIRGGLILVTYPTLAKALPPVVFLCYSVTSVYKDYAVHKAGVSV